MIDKFNFVRVSEKKLRKDQKGFNKFLSGNAKLRVVWIQYLDNMCTGRIRGQSKLSTLEN